MNATSLLLLFMEILDKRTGKFIFEKLINNYFLKFRIERYKIFKDFKKRIMVATDIFGRGIDIERVNIVINYDMPDGSDTYLHRVRKKINNLVLNLGWSCWKIRN